MSSFFINYKDYSIKGDFFQNFNNSYRKDTLGCSIFQTAFPNYEDLVKYENPYDAQTAEGSNADVNFIEKYWLQGNVPVGASVKIDYWPPSNIGTYDAFFNAFINAPNITSCPEMVCGTPEELSITIDGFQDSIVLPDDGVTNNNGLFNFNINNVWACLDYELSLINASAGNYTCATDAINNNGFIPDSVGNPRLDYLFPSTCFPGIGIPPKWYKGKIIYSSDSNCPGGGSFFFESIVDAPETWRKTSNFWFSDFGLNKVFLEKQPDNPDGGEAPSWISLCGLEAPAWPTPYDIPGRPKFNALNNTIYDPNNDPKRPLGTLDPYMDVEYDTQGGNTIRFWYPDGYGPIRFNQGPVFKVGYQGCGTSYDCSIGKIIGYSDMTGLHNQFDPTSGNIPGDYFSLNSSNNGWKDTFVCGLRWSDIINSSSSNNPELAQLKKATERPNLNNYSFIGRKSDGNYHNPYFWYDFDYNGEYKCYRPHSSFRPELIPRISRQQSLPNGFLSSHPKEWDAELLFELIGKPQFDYTPQYPCQEVWGIGNYIRRFTSEPDPTPTIYPDFSAWLNADKDWQQYYQQVLYPSGLDLPLAINGVGGNIGDQYQQVMFKLRSLLSTSYNDYDRLQSLKKWYTKIEPYPNGNFLYVDYRCSPRNIYTENRPGHQETCVNDSAISEPFIEFTTNFISYGNDYRGCFGNAPNAPIGTVKPHLKFRNPDPLLYNSGIYSEGPAPSGTGAVLKPILKPYRYIDEETVLETKEGSWYDTTYAIQPTRGQKPQRYGYSWSLDSVFIEDGGSGYKVGNIFILDYDPAWIGLPYINGEVIFTFPDHECCTDNTEKIIDWSDKPSNPAVTRYHKRKDITCEDYADSCGCSLDPDYARYYTDRKIVYQRVCVTEVDQNGAILNFEIIPWYRTNEITDPIFCTTQSEKTPYYVEYTRFLCHPRSVTHGGKYYSIGDEITWECDNDINDCSVWKSDDGKEHFAKAIIVDVDDEGSILDWHINGSQIWKRNNGDILNDVTVYGVNNKGDGLACYNFEYRDGLYYFNEKNDRGNYKFEGKDLCSLVWKGKGVPIRTTGWEDETIVYKDFSFPKAIYPVSYNATKNTGIQLSISRKDCHTKAGIWVRPWPYSEKNLSILIRKFKTLLATLYDNKLYASVTLGWYKERFIPYPECNGGGAEITLNYGSNIFPHNNDSVFGGTITSANILCQGSLYSYVDKTHTIPILPTGVELIATVDHGGRGAKIGSFSFASGIINFPNTKYINSLGVNLDPYRFSYFPVSSATISDGGSGYVVGDSFQILPNNAITFVDGWSADGGDNPDKVLNGGYYTGNLNNLLKNSSYLPDHMDGDNECDYIYNDNGTPNDPNDDYVDGIESSCQEISPVQGICTLKVGSIGSSGNITSLVVEHSGMMYRPVWTTGKKNPDAIEYIESTLGYGAKPTATVGINQNDSTTFGKLLSFSIGQYTAEQFPDPYFNTPQVIPFSDNVQADGTSNQRGYGRDYANPGLGSFWMVDEISSIGDINLYYGLLGHFNWGLNHFSQFGSPYAGKSGKTLLHYLSYDSNGTYNSSLGDANIYQTHTVIGGTAPNFVSQVTLCSFDDCYHDLLNKTYPLYRISYPTSPNWTSAALPKHGGSSDSFVLLQSKDINDPKPYVLIEYGFNMTIKSHRPEDNIPNKVWPGPKNGRTFTTPIDGIYIFSPGTTDTITS